VFDQSGDPDLFNVIEKRLESPGEDRDSGNTDGGGGVGSTRFTLTRQTVPPNENVQESFERRISEQKGSDEGYLILPPGILDNAEPVYRAKNTSDFSIVALRQAISSAVSQRRLERAHIDHRQIAEYTKQVDLKREKISASGKLESGGENSFILGFVMLFFIYMTVLFYGLFVMRGVIEEKQSRIIEVLISSAKPMQVMMGKLIGIGLVGLTQLLIWVLSTVILSMFGASILASKGISIPQVPVTLLICFVTYFVLGYFLFATLYAMVGATVSSEEEAQQAQFPVTILIIIPMMIFGMIVSNPNSPSSIALSMVPFFAPTLMMMRITVASPPVWQILLSMAIMVATILGCLWVASRIYRVGILMYGKRPSLAELGRWLRYS